MMRGVESRTRSSFIYQIFCPNHNKINEIFNRSNKNITKINLSLLFQYVQPEFNTTYLY